MPRKTSPHPGKRSVTSNGRRGQRQSGAESRLVLKRKSQSTSGRKVRARDEVAEARRRLDARIAREREQPALGAAVGAEFTEITQRALNPSDIPPAVAHTLGVETVAPRRWRYEPYENELKPGFTGADALRMLDQGYAVPHIMRKTGCGFVTFEGLPLDEDGRLRQLEL